MIAALGVSAALAVEPTTDWSQMSGEITIPAGETWYADESDMAKVNALTSITLSGAETGDKPVEAATLVFRDTSTAPKADLLKGAGVVRKSGMSVWGNYGNAQTGFTGDWHLDGGVVTNTASGAFGNIALDDGVGKLYVHPGAALVVNSRETEFFYRDLHINGSGNLLVPRALSMLNIKDSGVRYLYLDGDAAIETGPVHYWMSSIGGAKKNGRLFLGEHTLTQYGSGLEWYFLGVTIDGVGKIVFNGKGVVHRTGSWGGTEEGSAPFVFGAPGGGSMNFGWYNRPGALHRDLHVNVPVIVSFMFNSADARRNLMSTNYNHVTGDVSLNGTGSNIKFVQNENEQNEINVAFTLSGSVSGDGGVQVGNMGNNERNLLRLYGHNTYEGSTVVTEKGLNGIMAAWPDSIPDYSKTFVTNGYVAARLGLGAAEDGVTPRWTADDLWNVMTNVNFAQDGHLSIDAEECENATWEMSVADIAANVPNLNQRKIGVAGGTLKLRVGAGDEQRIGLAADRGTLELVGGGTFRLAPTNTLKGIISLNNPDSAPIAEMRVTDGSTVVQSNEWFSVGGHNKAADIKNQGIAKLVVSNGTWRTEYDVEETDDTTDSGVPALARGAIWVGRQNRGILEIQKDGLVSNKVVVGGGQAFHRGDGIGAIYLSDGGKLHICKKGSAAHLASSIGSASYGYLQQTGGELSADSLILGGYGTGVAHVYGGTALFTTSIELSHMNYGNGCLYITNGVWKTIPGDSGGIGYLRLCYGANESYGCLTLDGPDAQILLNGVEGDILGSQTAKYIERLNINHGGTIQYGRFNLYNKALLNKAVYPYPCVMNVNGGIIKRRSGWCSTDSMFGENPTNRLSRIVVYEEGMTLDTDGKDVRQIAETPFEGADGNGIMRIDLGGEIANLIGAPRVDIENVDGGEGHGATAVAAWDPETRVLKGVHITSHGWGYTQGKVKVTLSTGSQWSMSLTGNAITVGANTAGGFTKRGAGTLTLNAANTWAQWTKVEGGTLKAGADWAIPAGTAVMLSGGGILDFNGKTGEVASVTYGVGGGSIINAENVVLSQSLSFTIDVEDMLAGRFIPVTGDISLDGVEIRLTGDLTRLDPETCRRHTLISVSGGTVSGMPVLAGSEVPEKWELAVGSGKVRLVYPYGFMLMVK
jgi:autotransporter-associated beta strand protein